MIPKTLNNLDAFEVMSAMQKHIRRGEEREAMHCACELGHSSKAFFTMLCNRLELIAHEDIGLANREACIFTAATIAQVRRFYEPDKPGKWRLMVGNVILTLCRSAKCREGDHFQAAIGQRVLMDDTAPELPDYAFDHHTSRGRKLGRDLQHFRDVSTKLIPPAEPDTYEAEAYQVWQRKHDAKDVGTNPGRKAKETLFS
ncbi:hypothetical protein [Aeoliella sp.]|uniref:hypothetical protein n=1 Tax=Aeoliella sp. TaxID=2795800 RepID=UPI003CCBFE2D